MHAHIILYDMILRVDMYVCMCSYSSFRISHTFSHLSPPFLYSIHSPSTLTRSFGRFIFRPGSFLPSTHLKRHERNFNLPVGYFTIHPHTHKHTRTHTPSRTHLMKGFAEPFSTNETLKSSCDKIFNGLESTLFGRNSAPWKWVVAIYIRFQAIYPLCAHTKLSQAHISADDFIIRVVE